MKNMKTMMLAAVLCLNLPLVNANANAPDYANTANSASPAGQDNTAVASTMTDATDGEIIKIDKSSNKVTIKHGPIKNLDMPGMTMVFRIKEAAMLDTLEPGNKVKFRAEKANGALYVVDIQVVR
ncbi:copper-binding protein [Undibacterium sp. Ji50W]|uniref:copper-binding protein n=1 Tax=Undibacterium sp. Ji50W TaxID=3413041 RepID=UPI003BF0235E